METDLLTGTAGPSVPGGLFLLMANVENHLLMSAHVENARAAAARRPGYASTAWPRIRLSLGCLLPGAASGTSPLLFFLYIQAPPPPRPLAAHY